MMEKKQVIQNLTDLMATIQAAYFKGRMEGHPLLVYERMDGSVAISIDLYHFGGDGKPVCDGLKPCAVTYDDGSQGTGWLYCMYYDADDVTPLTFLFDSDAAGDITLDAEDIPEDVLRNIATWLEQAMQPVPQKKTAFLVSFCPMTRVVIEAADPDNLTDEEQDQLVRLAREQIVENAVWKLNGENIDEVRLDDECPYGTYPDEE